MAQRPRANKTSDGERESVAAQIIFDSATRMFFYTIKFESDDDPDKSGPFPTAHTATDACLTHIDQYCSSIGGIDAADVTLTSGDWERFENYPHVRFEAGPRYRNWLSGNIYDMNQKELAQEAANAIEKLTEATETITARHSVPMGQRIDAATVLYEKLYGKWRRGSNAPTMTMFLDEMFQGMEARTRQRHHKAYLLVVCDDWPSMDAAYRGTKRGLERIFDAARQWIGRPTKKRETVSRARYDRLLNRFELVRDLATRKSIDDVRLAFAEFDQEDENDATPEDTT
jgi:hypothetical protein